MAIFIDHEEFPLGHANLPEQPIVGSYLAEEIQPTLINNHFLLTIFTGIDAMTSGVMMAVPTESCSAGFRSLSHVETFCR